MRFLMLAGVVENRLRFAAGARRGRAAWAAAMVLMACAPPTVASAGPATGPLRVHASNPRYFADASGKAVYLTGSHMWNNFIDWGASDPPAPLNYTAFLDWLEQHHHNFIRGWVFEIPKDPALSWYFSPPLFVRTGPGSANDGKPKFNLTQVNPVYLSRIRDRIIEAGNRGIYVSVMLFQPIYLGIKRGTKPPETQNPWYMNPFHRNNNINGIDGDPNHDGEGWEVSTLPTDTYYSPPISPAVTALQEGYVDAVIDAFRDLDNVVWEIGNESLLKSDNWQNHFINHVKNYEQQKGYKKHLVRKTAMDEPAQGQYVNGLLFDSPADVIAPNGGSSGQYRTDPPTAGGSKIVLLDTDHLWGVGGDVAWVWKSFTRGIHPIFMDPYFGDPWAEPDLPEYESIRKAMGQTLSYAERTDPAGLTPQSSGVSTPSSTRYCLFKPGTSTWSISRIPAH